MTATIQLNTNEIALAVQEAIKPLLNQLKEEIKRELQNNEEEERLTIKEVRHLTKLGTTSIYNKMKNGTFPQSFKVGRRTYWLKSDIKEWVKNDLKKWVENKKSTFKNKKSS